MKRILLLSALILPLLARASGVAALGDIACGIYTNTATVGIPYVENGWLDSVWTPSWPPDAPWWYSTNGFVLANAAPNDNAALVSGQLKWAFLCAANELEAATGAAGGAGSPVWWKIWSFPVNDNDRTVSTAELLDTLAPLVERLRDLYVDSLVYSLPELPHEAYWPGASNAPVALKHLKHALVFDPHYDSDQDGIPDWWERYMVLDSWSGYESVFPGDDPDCDGLTNLLEFERGSDPLDRDTDGDGLVDGVDPDPRSWTDPGDYDHDGVPDALETHWFGGTDVVGSASDLDWAGFPFAMALSAGLCPTNPIPETAYPTNGLSSLRIVPGFAIEAEAGTVVWTNMFFLPRHAAWEQYFVSSTPCPDRSGGGNDGSWALEGLVLEYSFEGTATTNYATAGSPLLLPAIPESDQSETITLRLALRTTGSGLATCATPLYLLSYSPAIEFPGIPSATAGDAVLSAVTVGSDVSFSIDWSLCPADIGAPGDGSDEILFDSFAADWVDLFRDAQTGRITGGTLHGVHAGVYEIPFIAPPPVTPLRTVLPLPDSVRRFVLAVLSPRLTFGWGHGPDPSGLSFESGVYSRTHDFPLDDASLYRGFHSDSNGWYVCDCAPVLELGVSDEFLPPLATNVQRYVSGLHESATGTVLLASMPVCVLGADHDRTVIVSPGILDSGCGCETCKVDGDSEGSVRFRLSLGQPRAGQYSGFLWFRSDGPVSVTPQLFELLARSDASVSDTTASGVRTIVCSDARGRTVVASPIADGVRLVVTTTATGEPDHSWTIVNENGSASRIRFVRTSRAGNVQSDRTYVLSDGVWSVSDNVAGTTETLVRTDALDDRACPTSSVERVLCDSSGLELSHTFVSSRRYGEGASAVLREIERREDVGTPYEKASFATYWESGGKRFGLPRLVSGNARAWSWTDYDSRGRPILVFDQRDGSPCPADGTGWTLASHPASLKAFATVHSYAPLAGDSNHPDDDATPRTTSRYVVDGASNVLIGKTWTVITHGTTAGRPSVSVRTERAASQSAPFGDSGNAVSVSVSVDPEAPGVPLLLRGRPLSYTDEDGVTTAYEYAFGVWDPATRTFAPEGGSPSGGAGAQSAPEGVSHLRTRVFTTTPEAPSGVPLVSTVSETVEDAVHGNEVWSATRVLLANGSLSDPFDWEARTYDDQDRLRSTLYADGSSSTNAYSCCRLLYTVGRDGRKVLRSAQTGTDHLYYAMEEVSLADLPRITNSAAYGGWPQGLYRTTQHFLDALGRETNVVTRIGNNPGQATNAVFSAPGDFTASESTSYAEGTSDESDRIDSRYNWTTRTRTSSPSSDQSDVWVYASPGTKWTSTLSYRGGRTVSTRNEDGDWVRTTSLSSYGSDGRRTDVSVTETSDGECVTNSVSVSDFLGRTVRVTTPLSDSTYAYDGASSRAVSVSDSVSGLSVATIYDALREPVGSVSVGVSSLSNTRYELSSNAWWRVSETREAAGAQTNLLSTVRERLTGLSDALRSETVSIDESGVATRTVSSFDPATKILTETTASPVASTVVRRSMFGREIERTEEGEIVQTFYDPFGRACASARLGVEGTVPYKRFGTILGCDENGDVCWRYEPVAADDGVPILSSYDSLGNLVSEETYVEGSYGEDYTTRTVTHDLSGRVTEESGDAVYPTKQSYDALGRRVSLSTTRNGTAWDVTRWGYDPATGLCTNKTYADGSLVAHTFTADGLPLRTTLASGAWTQNSYDANRRLSSVSTSDGEGNVSYLYDAFGRVTRATGGAARYDYARDALGRVTSEVRRTGGIRPTVVSSLSRPYDAFGRPAGYGLTFYGDFRQGVCYTWGMDGKLAGMVCSNAQGRAVEVSFDWDRGRGVGWSVEGLGDCYAYFTQVFERDAWRPWLVPYAAAGKPGPRGTMPDYSVSYAFDRLGRPVSRSGDAFAYNPRGEVTNAVVGGDAFRYAYDHIGNRETAYEAGTTTAYSANNVNQYTAVGSAQPSYDADGNLVDDGTRTFAWSASGHLTDAATSSRWLWADYDHLGRRTFRATDRRSGFSWLLSDEREFVYDGWNLIHEHRYDYQDDSDTDIEYFWGPDLSGSLQGAGGVGGLVAVSIDGDYYFPGYDNNGNVIGYWDESGDIVAEYAYDAFGNIIDESGSMADFFPHRFSTKYYDAETDLYYYGYRYYSPSLGRWISRDPIEEDGGYNLFDCCQNNMLFQFDYLGQMVFAFLGESYYPPPRDPNTIRFEFIIFQGKQNIDTFLEKLHSLGFWKWRNMRRNNKVMFDGKVFTGSRAEYESKVKREMLSNVFRPTSASLDSFMRLVKKQIPLLTEDYDEIGVFLHGASDGLRPRNTIQFQGLEYFSQDAISRAFENVFKMIPSAARGLFVSCYQDYSPPNGTSREDFEKALNDSLEYIELKPARGIVDCEIDFLPFRLFKRKGNSL